MSSGVKVAPEVVEHFRQMRVHHSGADRQEHLKLVLFKIDTENIYVDKDNIYKVKDFSDEKNIFGKILGILPEKECCYALYDCHYATQETCKEDLVFIMWAPEGSAIKDKMLYASSKEAIKKQFGGVKCEWQVNDDSDRNQSVFLDKLAPKGGVVSLEGVTL